MYNIGIDVHTKSSTFCILGEKGEDDNDSAKLARHLKASLLPQEVFVPSPFIRGLRKMLLARYNLVSARTRVINSLRGMLRSYGKKYSKKAFSSPQGWERLEAEDFPSWLKTIISSYYREFLNLSNEIAQLELSLKDYERVIPSARLLQTIPGVDMITSLFLVAYLDKIERFSKTRKVGSYFGIVPSIIESGSSSYLGPITKEGNPLVRWHLVQAAKSMSRSLHRLPRLKRWYWGIVLGQEKQKASVALARKISIIATHLLKEGKSFDESRYQD